MDVLYLVRHGETEWNRQRRLQGRLDSALTAEGREHARANGALLAREGVEHLLVSPLGRARETADLIRAEYAEGLVSVAYEDRLVERHCGAWEGLTMDDIEARFPDEWAARNRDPFHHRPPGGENLPDMLTRIAPFAERVRALPLRSAAIVSHGISGRVLLTHFLGLAPAAADKVRQPNDLVYRLEFSAAGVRPTYFRAGVGPQPGLFTVAPELVG
jgi:broad specificity phosphatase PhoE